MITEADTCRRYVLPKLKSAGWDDENISEQKTITDGQILVIGNTIRRRKQKRVDYLLKYNNDIMLAIVEAKSAYKSSSGGIQQAKEYAVMLDVKFAYSTNGHGITEHDFITGIEKELNVFPSPEELWNRLRVYLGMGNENDAQKFLTPSFNLGRPLRYYQQVAINRALEHVLKGKKRILLTLATGTGKTFIAFEIIWKLWNSKWNSKGDYRRPRVLYLADRNILIDDPKDKVFTVFGDARLKIQGEAIKSREIYFSTYQAIAKDQRRPGLYKEFSKDFFDLILVDECHRGSARDDSNWREILEYFDESYQIGMTATPLRKDNSDTYEYFGNPVYLYSLKQGIEDGFLAPYRVYRIVTNVDATGWRPQKGELDRHGREIPDMQYTTNDFERNIVIKDRTLAIANNISDFLKKYDRFSKTIVFCVDMEHAEEMRRELCNANNDLVKEYPDYVARVVSEEGDIGRGYLSKFQELETKSPVILTTSQLLTTGIDAPMCKNVVIAKVINSMTDFKQIIGRGTRIRDDYGKFYFNILDYTGSATKLFADPQFDGEPAFLAEQEMDEKGKSVTQSEIISDQGSGTLETSMDYRPRISDDSEGQLRKYYVDGVTVKIAAEVVYELDPQGKNVRVVKYTEYTREKVRSMYTQAADLRSKWGDPEQRKAIIETLEERGISLEKLMDVTRMYDADRFDLLCHVAYNSPLRTRRERAEALRQNKSFFDQYSPVARQILDEILTKYIEYGTEQFNVPEILKLEPIVNHGNVMEIANIFGGVNKLRNAISEMQILLYKQQELK
jgi:type I restriction enzyme R subunit